MRLMGWKGGMCRDFIGINGRCAIYVIFTYWDGASLTFFGIELSCGANE